MAPHALLASTHPLASGERVRLRLTRPSDAPRVSAFLDGLSAEATYRRFGTLSNPGLVRHFTFYDPREKVVVAAAMPVDGHEEIVGLADFTLLETGLAELGLVVADEHCRKGVGRLLAEAAAELAGQRGASHLKAEILDRNPAMEAVMRSLGRTVQTVEDGSSVIYARIPARVRSAA